MDWKKLLQSLKDAGFTQGRIADLCHTRQSTVSDLARGVTDNPTYELGSKLIALHRRHAKARA